MYKNSSLGVIKKLYGKIMPYLEDDVLSVPSKKVILGSYKIVIKQLQLIEEQDQFISDFDSVEFSNLDYNFADEKFIFDESSTQALAKEFFDTLDEPFKSLFLQAEQDASINFVNSKNLDSRVDKVKFTDTLFLSCSITGDFESLLNYVHELAHVIEISIERKLPNNAFKIYYCEMFETFIEFLVMDFLIQKGYDSDKIKSFLNLLFKNRYAGALEISDIVDIIRYTKNTIVYNEFSIWPRMFEKNPSLYQIFRIHPYHLRTLLIYNNSFLAALELYIEYLNEPEQILSFFLKYFEYQPGSFEEMEEFIRSNGIVKGESLQYVRTAFEEQ